MPKRDRLLEAGRRREIDAILVWRLDRWGRSLPDLVVTLHELGELGVGFVSLTGRAMAGLLGMFAELETGADHRVVFPDRRPGCVPARVGVLAADHGTRRVGYSSTSETLAAVMARPSQRSKVARSVHASMRASSSWLGVSCRCASTRRREARASVS